MVQAELRDGGSEIARREFFVFQERKDASVVEAELRGGGSEIARRELFVHQESLRRSTHGLQRRTATQCLPLHKRRKKHKSGSDSSTAAACPHLCKRKFELCLPNQRSFSHLVNIFGRLRLFKLNWPCCHQRQNIWRSLSTSMRVCLRLS